MTGAVGQQRVPKSFLENYKFPLPTIAEQELLLDRIKAEFIKMGTIMDMVDKLSENLVKLKLSYYESIFPSTIEDTQND